MRLKRVRVDLRDYQVRYIDDLVKVQAKYQDRMRGVMPDLEVVVSPEQRAHIQKLFSQQVPLWSVPPTGDFGWNGFKIVVA